MNELRRRPLISGLEPRMMFDAAAPVTVAEAVTSTGATAPSPTADSSSAATSTSTSTSTSSPAPAQGTEIAFVEASVLQNGTLPALRDGVQMVVLNGAQDGISQITQALDGKTDISAIYLITQGKDGEVDLGSTALDSATLASRQAEIAAWGDHLAQGADVLIYGSDVAKDSAGQAFVDTLAATTGATVAASTNTTGGTIYGGDWTLEYSSGTVHAQSFAAADALSVYQGDLTWGGSTTNPNGIVRDVEGATQVVFIDGGLRNLDALVAAAPADAYVVVLNTNADGVQQITQFLDSHQGMEAVHIISHGDSGQITLGTAQISEATLAQYSTQFQQWQHDLAPGADLMLYGCDVGAGTDGQQFIADLAHATGTTVAASTDVTGSTAWGANWSLETQTGTLHTMSIDFSAAGWEGLLPSSSGVVYFLQMYQLQGQLGNASNKYWTTGSFGTVPANTSWMIGVNGSYINVSSVSFTPSGTAFSGGTYQGNDYTGVLTFVGTYMNNTYVSATGSNPTAFSDPAANNVSVSLAGTISAVQQPNGKVASLYFWTNNYAGATVTDSATQTGLGFVLVVPGQTTGTYSSGTAYTTSANTGAITDALNATLATQASYSGNLGATADSLSLYSGATSTVSTNGTLGSGVLANDTDANTYGAGITPLYSVTDVAYNNSTPVGNVGSSIAGTYGHLTLNANGTYTYIANGTAVSAGASATDTFTYRVSNGLGGFSTTTLTITVSGQGPTAVADTGSATQNITLSKTSGTGVLSNDTDSDNTATKTVTGVSAGTATSAPTGNVGSVVHGTYGDLTLNADGSYSYTPNNAGSLAAGATATDTFSYTVTDSNNKTSYTTLTVTVASAKPTETVAITSMTNDSGTGADWKTSNATSHVVSGTVSTALAANEVVQVSYDGGTTWVTATMTDSTHWTATDSTTHTGNWTYQARITNTAASVSGTAVSQAVTLGAPSAVADTGSGTDGSTTTISATAGVLSNDTDSTPGATINVTGVAAGNTGTASSSNVGSGITGTYGTLTLNANGGYTYVANSNTGIATGSTANDVFTYTITDDGGRTSIATLTITVHGPAAPGVPSQTVAITGMTHDSGTDADFKTTDGSSSRTVNGTVSASLGANEIIEVSFDGGTTWTTATVNGGNNTWTVTDPGNHSGNWTYQARVRNTSNDLSSNAATQNVTLGSLTATNDTGSATQNVTDTVNAASGTLGNDSDSVPGATFTVTGVAAGNTGANGTGNVGSAVTGTYGTLTLNANGSYTYLANNAGGIAAGQTATDTFTYTITDDSGAKSHATVTITVASAKPTATVSITGMTNDSGTGADWATSNGSSHVLSGTVSAALAANEILEVSFDGGTTWTTVTVNGDKTWSTTDSSSHSGNWTYEARIRNTAANVSSTPVTQAVTLGGPSAVNDTANAAEGATVTVASGTGTLSNDTDTVPGSTRTVTGVAAGNTAANGTGNVGSQLVGTYGTLTLNANGSYTYVANANTGIAAGSSASDVFTYTITDDGGAKAHATLTVTVSGPVKSAETVTPTPPPTPAPVVFDPPPPPPAPPPAPTPTPTPAPVINAPVVVTPPPVEAAPQTPAAQTTPNAQAPSVMTFTSDAGSAVQVINNLEVNVATAATSSTTTASKTEVQSYTIAAKELSQSGGGSVQLTVEAGLPRWMKVEANGDGVLKMVGERPVGDSRAYQVIVKIKRPNGDEANVVLVVKPSSNRATGDDAASAPQGQGAPVPVGGAKPPAAPARTGALTPEGNVAMAEGWLGELLAALDGDQSQAIPLAAEGGHFLDQFSAEAGALRARAEALAA